MMCLAKSKIENVTVELTVEETVGSQLGGYPMIHFGDVLIDSTMVAEVDTLAVIKAIVTSETVEDFAERISGCHNYSKMVILLKSYACTIVDNCIVADTEHNNQILELIDEQCTILQGDLDEYSIWDKTVAESRIYDLNRQLELIK